MARNRKKPESGAGGGMTIAESGPKIGSELRHITEGKTGSPQNVLRAAYYLCRRLDLGKDANTPPSASLIRALSAAKHFYPVFTFSLDRDYFGKPR